MRPTVARQRPRLTDRSYKGKRSWLLTICCKDRLPLLDGDRILSAVQARILRAAERTKCEVLAYCLMPNHVHLLMRGLTEEADVRAFVHRAKQMTGHEYRAMKGGMLWQRGYHDRVIRPHEPLSAIVKYILDNPVRAGLVQDPAAYPYSGVSDSLDATTLSRITAMPD
jgi:putative transposase